MPWKKTKLAPNSIYRVNQEIKGWTHLTTCLASISDFLTFFNIQIHFEWSIQQATLIDLNTMLNDSIADQVKTQCFNHALGQKWIL